MEESVFSVLQRGFTIPIRDPLWGHIYLTPGLASLTESAPFFRLGRILQLGPASYIYPGATHTRASHSLGVYYLARRLLISLCEKGASWTSPQGALSFLCAALLHDLGHFPYTHSLKELALEDHESLSAGIINSEPVKSLVGKAGADPEITAAIINKTSDTANNELRFYRRLLSGVLDPDKLDYLNRDARYCGVPYGAQDVDFIYSQLFPQKERGIEINSRGIPSVESILFSKYLMYRTVYWHRQVRSATAMIKKALISALEQGIIAAEELYNLDDQSLFALMAEKQKNLPALSLAERVREGRFYVESACFSLDSEKSYDNIEKRRTRENALAEEISRITGTIIDGESIIIDIPEPVSFETELFVRDENCLFGESSSVFRKGSVETFIHALRKVRIFSAQPLDIPKSILHNLKNWL
ncbi:MAG: HD domain-containing protein [Treponema sp.]|jgi:HD superfamily phosphohydrolase|nr:HD domain-containing protein [Treponema sp.]